MTRDGASKGAFHTRGLGTSTDKMAPAIELAAAAIEPLEPAVGTRSAAQDGELGRPAPAPAQPRLDGDALPTEVPTVDERTASSVDDETPLLDEDWIDDEDWFAYDEVSDDEESAEYEPDLCFA